MKNAFLFPGQGSQTIGMGKELYEQLPEAKRLLDNACVILNYDLKRIMFEGPEDRLTNTQFAQPAIYACSAMYLEKAKHQGIEYQYVAGHSLGEYSALYAAGVVGFEDGLKLVDKRGKAMAEQNGKGTMAAVLGLTEDELEEYLDGEVVMANLNTKTQIVISGTVDGIDRVEKKLKERIETGEAKIKRLTVSSAFHSHLMNKAAEIMRMEINNTVFHTPLCFVVQNVTGKVAMDAIEIKGNLERQVAGQVRWFDSIMCLKELGIEQFFEVGHGDVLRKINRAITLKPKCMSI